VASVQNGGVARHGAVWARAGSHRDSEQSALGETNDFAAGHDQLMEDEDVEETKRVDLWEGRRNAKERKKDRVKGATGY
jgi:hypothetical protein